MSSRTTRVAATLSAAAVIVAAAVSTPTHAAESKSVAVSESVSLSVSHTFTPIADARVQEDRPWANFGASDSLGVDGESARRSFLTFALSGLTQPIERVTLRLRVTDAPTAMSPEGGVWTVLPDHAWAEDTLHWRNQPPIRGTVVADVGEVASGTWVTIDLTGAVTGNGTVSIAGASTSVDGADFDSSESSHPPELVVTTAAAPAPSGDPVLVGAGDIATTGTGDSATAALIRSMPSATVFTVGDNAYPSGTAAQFANLYAPTWGAFKNRTRPVPGNHDYRTDRGGPYYDYFGDLAGPRGVGYYSYDLGDWHVIALNTEVSMAAGSAQESWLRRDLAASNAPCTVAYLHEPLYTSAAQHSPTTGTRPLFRALFDHGAEVVVAGHNHNYERFAPMNPWGTRDDRRGIQTFVAGMGGASLYGFGEVAPHSLARNSDTHGVLKLTLHPTSWDWEFVPVAGGTYRDVGTGTCH